MKVLIAKPGLDGHDRGAKVIARAFEDAGAQVYYTGLHSTVEEIVEFAETEQIDIMGVSLLTGAHQALMPKIIEECKNRDLNIIFLLGGIIPQKDRPGMLDLGVDGIFGPGSSMDDIVQFAMERYAAAHTDQIVEQLSEQLQQKKLNF